MTEYENDVILAHHGSLEDPDGSIDDHSQDKGMGGRVCGYAVYNRSYE